MTRTKPRANANMPNNFVSVLDYGADPTGQSDSTAAIQAAIDYANDQGGLGETPGVFLPTGIYYVSGGISIPTYCTFYGEGDQSVIKLKDDAAAGTYGILEIKGADGVNSIIIRDIAIWGNMNNQSNSPNCHGIYVNTVGAPGIYNTFSNLYIKECTGSSVYIEGKGLANSMFSNSMFRDSLGVANFYSTACERVDINSCRVRTGQGAETCGFKFLGADNREVSITYCRIDDNASWGVLFSEGDGRFKVSNNTLRGNKFGGIWVGKADNNVISNNLLFENGSSTTNNQNIFVNEANNTVVSGNNCSGTGGNGIRVQNSDFCNLSNNNITAVNLELVAVVVKGSNYCNISNNIVHDVTGHGIMLETSSYSNVSNNIFIDCGQATDDSFSAIYIFKNSSYNLIQSNIVNCSPSASVKVKHSLILHASDCQLNRVMNNDLLGYVTSGIEDNGDRTSFDSENRSS